MKAKNLMFRLSRISPAQNQIFYKGVDISDKIPFILREALIPNWAANVRLLRETIFKEARIFDHGVILTYKYTNAPDRVFAGHINRDYNRLASFIKEKDRDVDSTVNRTISIKPIFY